MLNKTVVTKYFVKLRCHLCWSDEKTTENENI